MERTRGFEVVTKYKDKGLKLPERATKHSAGYDFEASEDVSVPSIWKAISNDTEEGSEEFLKSTLVPTGIKAYMLENDYLMLANRSSNPMKHQLSMPNGVGIVDADYYGNKENEGEIFFQFINYGLDDHTIRKGERIGQGVFMTYLTTDEDSATETRRIGGFGSSGR